MAMSVHHYEKAFLWFGAVMLVVFMGALLFASVAMGIHLPGKVEQGVIDPSRVRTIPPFDQPGVREVGPGRYEAVIIGQAWAFQPREIRVPAGAEVTFLSTSVDVLHGLHVEDSRINMMLIPGQISRNAQVFDRPGTYRITCHEFCGAGHHLMFGTLIVEDPATFQGPTVGAPAGAGDGDGDGAAGAAAAPDHGGDR